MILLDKSYTVFDSETTFLDGEPITLAPRVQGTGFTASVSKVSSRPLLRPWRGLLTMA